MDGSLRYTIFLTYLTKNLVGNQEVETEILNTTGESLTDDIVRMMSNPGGGIPIETEILSLTVNLSTRQSVSL